MERSAFIQLTGLGRTYGSGTDETKALLPTTIGIRKGEFISVVGRSGCGKSTLLNLVAGLDTPSTGSIHIGGRRLEGPSRDVGIVFQKSVLLDWRTILDNILLPAEIIGLDRAQAHRRALELLDLVGLSDFGLKYPRQLSGGMQQRAALARSLVYDPDVLLMDEPFAALDAITREQMDLELLRIWQASGKTIIFVTHDIEEAALLADRVVLMSPRPGRIREVIDVSIARPRSTFTQTFADIRHYIRDRMD